MALLGEFPIAALGMRAYTPPVGSFSFSFTLLSFEQKAIHALSYNLLIKAYYIATMVFYAA